MARAEHPLSLDTERSRRAYASGRRAHPRLALDLEAFEPYARRSLPHHENGDFYLVVACDLGVEGSWERLQARFRRPLRALLRRRGVRRHEVPGLLADIWGRLASPPVRGPTRTRLGTYDGQGALLAWLTTVAWRRMVDHWRGARESRPLGDTPRPAPAMRSDPAARLACEELDTLVADVLRQAWAALTTRELEVVVLKYRHGLSQREIAGAMRVGAPRVTRLLQSAAHRLRASIERRLELRAYLQAEDAPANAVAMVLGEMLERSEAARAPAPDRTRDPSPRDEDHNERRGSA